jgi:hypothetical protein
MRLFIKIFLLIINDKLRQVLVSSTPESNKTTVVNFGEEGLDFHQILR